MSLFNGKRLDNKTFKLDVKRMRTGWYSDKYFPNIATVLSTLAHEGYTYEGHADRLPAGVSPEGIACGNIEVEMQWFTRRRGTSVIVGVDKVLTMLKECTGYFEGKKFINTSDTLKVWAVQDGNTTSYSGDPLKVQPVIRVQGRYRDFALLETATLGILARSTRIATNVYETLIAARGKPMLFFPARFDLHEVQAADGYAYQIAVERYNKDYASTLGPFVSTDAQGDWWGGAGGGTVSHSTICSFLGDSPEAMLQFSRIMDVKTPRIMLVDFDNDCVNTSIIVAWQLFNRYMDCLSAGKKEEALKYRLDGVRLDTGGSMRDKSVEPLGDPALDLGVNARLVHNVRKGLDDAWKSWDIPSEWREEARKYCQSVKIVVSGGFNPERIAKFEKLGVPVDTYAVGSYFFDNHERTNTDFTADVVRVKAHNNWLDLAKVGRHATDNPDLIRIW
ncbi:MAG: nicotinate phosphoribosyltransferase [Anaerolineaceae bacterium]|nr:nicotinate phosphoribosyltransferase [Anaerolineaceae bacterium]